MTDLLKWAETEAKTSRAAAADTVYEHEARYHEGRAEVFEGLLSRLGSESGLYAHALEALRRDGQSDVADLVESALSPYMIVETESRSIVDDLAEAKRVIWRVRHVARDAYKDAYPNAAEVIMRIVDEYGATRGLRDDAPALECRPIVQELERVTSERDEAQANYQFMVQRAADEKLDGYRELGARVAKAERKLAYLRTYVIDLAGCTAGHIRSGAQRALATVDGMGSDTEQESVDTERVKNMVLALRREGRCAEAEMGPAGLVYGAADMICELSGITVAPEPEPEWEDAEDDDSPSSGESSR